MTTVARKCREFAGMVYPEALPFHLRDKDVTQVDARDIPELLRDCATDTLGDMSGTEWWSLGEFRYAGVGEEYQTAFARRAGRTIHYGVECFG